MSTDPKERLLEELLDRLRRLDCLALVTKALVFEVARHRWNPEDLQVYLSGRLAFVERYIAPVDHPAFVALCRRLAVVDEPPKLLRALGLSGEWDPWGWLEYAYQEQRQAPECLYCLANHFALPFFSKEDMNSAAFASWLLVNPLLFLGRHMEAVAVLEGFAELAPVLYANPAALAEHLDRHFGQRVEANNAANYVSSLANALQHTDRHQHAVAVLESFAGLAPAVYANPAALAHRLHDRLGQRLDANNAEVYVSVLANALRFVGRDRDAVAVMESFSGLAPAVYANPAALAEHLDSRLGKRLDADNAACYVRTLAKALQHTGRHQDAVAVLEGFAGLTPAVYANPAALAEHLDRRFGKRLEANNAANYVCSLANALQHTGRNQDAVAVLEGFAGLAPAVYANPAALADHLDSRLGKRLEANHAAGYVIILAETLERIGRDRDAAAALEGYARGFPWLDGQVPGPIPLNTCTLVRYWLACFGGTKQAVNVCDRLIPYLRQTFYRPDCCFEDRRRFVETIGPLRAEVIRVADARAACAADPQEAEACRKQALLWDAELGQCMVLERFLLGRAWLAGTDGAALLASNRWPYYPPVSPMHWSGHRPPDRGLEPSANTAFDTTSGDASVVDSQVGRWVSVADQAWFEKARHRLREGLDERRLARELGQDTVLLRATLAPGGVLLWTALLSNGERLTVLAHDEGRGRPTNAADLAWAVARHELRVTLAYLPADRRGPVRKALAGAQPPLAAAPEDFAKLALNRLRQLAERLADAGAPKLASRVLLTVGPLLDSQPGAGGQGLTAWIKDVRDQWAATMVATSAAVGLDFPASINRATTAFIQEVEMVWSLDGLAGQLDPERHDVMVQVDGMLHSVPVALLSVGDKPLWQHVRSVRASLSVLLDALQRDTEADAGASDNGSNRLLTVSWFAEGDRAGIGAAELHHGQAELSRRHGLEWYAAAVDPEGTTALLFAGLDLGGFRAVSVCGHGNEYHAGVELGPGRQLWDGQGRDLSGVELLLLVSCSLGRIASTGERDVEGFCVQLALQRARSVLACRWPVQCQQATDVANEVLAHYLRLREDIGIQAGSSLTAARLRARALNLARTELLKDARDDYFNTIAAFELYGLA